MGSSSIIWVEVEYYYGNTKRNLPSSIENIKSKLLSEIFDQKLAYISL